MATIRNTLETNFTTRGATRAVRETEQIGRAQTRLGQGSASAGRSFAAQSQGLGGLVGIYAAAAANVFAISAAFQALNASAQFETIIRGTESLANAVGTSANQVISSLKKITGGQLSIVEAARNANLALSAGFNVDQIEQLGSVAIKASRALGRDLGDSFQRLARGAIKLEPELLDELGIFTRIEPAVNAYALSVGKSATQLTQFERRQAFANQVIKDGTDAFKDIDTSVISTQETFEKLVANFSDLAITVGAFVADALVPLAEFLDKNLGNRILLLGSIGLIVFNGLRVALVGLATTGIGALSASLAGLSANFAATRVNAGELANEAADVAEQFRGQGAFVGGNASEGAALKKALAEGGVNTREAVRLQERIPDLLREETDYRIRLGEREDAGLINAEARGRLEAQSVARGAALTSTQTLVTRQLATAGPLAQNMARGLNAAAVGAAALGKALSFGLKLLNAIGIIFVVLQGIGSIIGIDVFDKAREFYEYLFDASAAFKTGQESLAKVFDDQATNIRKVTEAQIAAKVALADDKGITPNVDADTIEDLQRQLTAAKNQKQLMSSSVFTPITNDSEFGIAAAQAATDLANFKELNGDILAEDANMKSELMAMKKAFHKRYGLAGSTFNVFSDDSGRRPAQAAIQRAKDDLKIYEEISKKYEELSKVNNNYQGDIADANAVALVLAGGDQELLDKTIDLVNTRLADLEARIATLTEAVELTTNLRDIVEISGALANSLETANPLLNDMFNAKVIGDADAIAKGLGRLEITVNGITKTIATLNKDGFIPKEQEQSVQDALVGMDMLRKLMEDLEDGTISNTEATKKLMSIRRNLTDTTNQPLPLNPADIDIAALSTIEFAASLSKVEERAQVVVNEFNSMNALADKLSKKFKSAATAFDNLFTSGTVNADTGEIAKNQEEVLANEAKNLVLLRQKMSLLKGQRDMTGTIEEIERALTVSAKGSFINQVKRVPLVEKELKAQDKLLKAAYEQLRAQEAKNREAARSLDIAKKQADIESMTQRGAFIQRRAGAENPFESVPLQAVQDNARLKFRGPTVQASFRAPRGGAADEGALGSNQLDPLDQSPQMRAARASVQQSLARDFGSAETFGNDAKAINLMQLRLNDANVAMENATDAKRRYKSVTILGTDDIERLKAFNTVMNVNAEKTALAARQLRELNAVGRKGAAIERQGVMIDAEASAAGAQAASAARLAKAERETAKILDRTILKREDILKVELALEKTKMEEAKKSAGAQAGVARLKAKQDKAALDDQRAARKDQQADILAELKQRKDLFNQQEVVRQAEFEIMQLGKIFEQDMLRQQRDNIDLKKKDDLAALAAQTADRQAQNTLQRDKAALLLTQITHDKKVIADNRDLLVAEGNQKAKELTLRTTSKLDDPSQGLMDNVKDILENYDTISDLITASAGAQTDGIKAAAKGEKDLLKGRIDNLGLLISKNGDLEAQQRLVAKVQNEIMDMELTHAEQMMIADMANFDLQEKNIEKNLRKTLAGMGAEGAAAERLFKDKLEQLAYELSARKKLKELILGITNDINGGLANAIQKVFENISTRGASLTDGIKEIGLGMYEDIRKTIVDQTIVTPAQDMMKGFIGNLTGFDLDKKGIDDVELVGKKVPVTLDGAEEGPITKVKREMEEKGESFFTGFKEKAKGAFETIQSSLGEFGSKAMETFRGLGSSLKDLFTGEGGIMKSLSGFMQGITGNGGEGVGSTLFNLGKTALSFFGPAAAATGGLVGMTGVRNMAAGGQVNALRDRVPAMLEPGEFVIRKPAAKSIGNRALGQMNATGAAGMGNVQFNIVNEGAPKSAEQQGPPKFDADKIVVEVVMRDLQSNGPIRNAMRNG